jgi:hypothetical protein
VQEIKLSPTRAVAWKQGSGVIRLIHGREGFCYFHKSVGFCLLTGIACGRTRISGTYHRRELRTSGTRRAGRGSTVSTESA